MPQHPPWLRFQAYLVGLPKTGSTSIATVFGNYRTGHEWELMELVGAGMSRLAGQLTDEEFLASAGPRLQPPSLEMDSTTSHHLYADLLVQQFPHAVFVHTVRDVRTWTTSLLEMLLRKRLARLQVSVPYSIWERGYLDMMTGGTYRLAAPPAADDAGSLVALMAYWAEHMTQMSQVLPPDRSIVVPTTQIGLRLADLAALAGVPANMMRADLAHTNRSPQTLDRFSTFASPQLMAAYELHCADIMAERFPAEHDRWLTDYRTAIAEPAARAGLWVEHVEQVGDWVTEAVARYGPAAAR